MTCHLLLFVPSPPFVFKFQVRRHCPLFIQVLQPLGSRSTYTNFLFNTSTNVSRFNAQPVTLIELTSRHWLPLQRPRLSLNSKKNLFATSQKGFCVLI